MKDLRRRIEFRRLGTEALLLIALLAPPAGADTFVVTNTDNEGVGSLRRAIVDANELVGPDVITFAIPGPGPHVIEPSPDLPNIEEAVLVDGFSQAMDGSVRIVLSGDGQATPGTGLRIDRFFLQTAPADVEIRGLSIVGWRFGIVVATDVQRTALKGNRIGLLPDGTPNPNSVGVTVSCESDDTIVGGSASADANVISSNELGLLVTGDFARCESPANLSVLGNFIGADETGVTPRPNDGDGILVKIGKDVRIGDGTAAGANVIAWNGGNGVTLGPVARNVEIRGNSIHSNGGLAIDLQEGLFAAGIEGVTENDPPGSFDEDTAGANQLVNHPIILLPTYDEKADTTTVHVELDSHASEQFILEFYANAEPDNSGDPSGEHLFHGEAQELRLSLTIATDGAGHWDDEVVVPGSGPFLAASATRTSTLETSELSPTIPVVAHAYDVTNCDPSGEGSLAGQIAAAAGRGDVLLAEIRMSADCTGADAIVPTAPMELSVGRLVLRLENALGNPTEILAGAGPAFVVSADAIVATDFWGTTDEFVPFLLVTSSASGVAFSNVGCGGCATTPLGESIAGASCGTCDTLAIFEGSNLGLHHFQAVIDFLGLDCFSGSYLRVSQCEISGELGESFFNCSYTATDECRFESLFSQAMAVAESPAFGGGSGLAFSNRVRRSSFVDVGLLAVDLAPQGPTANDPLDADSGPNGGANYPEITSARIVGEELRVSVALDAEPEGSYVIDLLASDLCPAHGRGEGVYFATVSVETDGTGSGSGSTVAAHPLAEPATVAYVAGLATDLAGNTSEPGPCFAVVELPVDLFADDFESGDTTAWSATVPEP